MRQRLPVALSAAALTVAVFGSTPVGEAARDLVVPRNSVGTAQLRNNAVTSVKVRNGSLLAADFRRGQIPAGPAGPVGPQGPKGDRGDTGPAGAVSTVRTRTATANAPNGALTQTFAACQANERAIAGGVELIFLAADIDVRVSRPGTPTVPIANGATFTSWTGGVYNPAGGTGTVTFQVHVICAT